MTHWYDRLKAPGLLFRYVRNEAFYRLCKWENVMSVGISSFLDTTCNVSNKYLPQYEFFSSNELLPIAAIRPPQCYDFRGRRGFS